MIIILFLDNQIDMVTALRSGTESTSSGIINMDKLVKILGYQGYFVRHWPESHNGTFQDYTICLRNINNPEFFMSRPTYIWLY